MDKRNDLLAIFNAALAAVMPDTALLRHLRREGSALLADGKRFELGKGKVIVLGAGKGAAPMAQALEKLLGYYISCGLVVVKYGHGLKPGRIKITEAAHPVPDAAGLAAAQEIMQLASHANQDDLVLCLFTGGASALLPCPAPGLNLIHLQKATSLLLASGATISEVNSVRKHLSQLSGGQLARAAGKATILTLLVSDVIGDSPGDIASGPTAPDNSTYQDCLEIIAKYGLVEQMPSRAVALLKQGARGELPETPKTRAKASAKTTNIIVASNSQALAAAQAKARMLGYEPRIYAKPLAGEARETARELIRKAREIRDSPDPVAKPVCLLAGGETTVRLRGNGKGGRNQEMALAAALELVSEPGITCLFAGTDGTDGPTDAAGGFADAHTVIKLGGRTIAEMLLKENNSYSALALAGDLFVTGPTLTNVMDLAIILIQQGTH